MVKYPAQIDNSFSLPAAVDNFTPVTGDVVNRLRDAILAIETELGVKPGSIYTNVRTRLDTIENLFNLDIVALNGDLGGTTQDPLVIGLQGRPLNDIEPNNGQVLAWNGIVWLPSDVSAQLNVLPTHIVLPIELNFLCGDGYSNSSSPTRIGARVIDLDLIPSTYPDGRNRTMMFKAELQVTNAATDGYVLLKDVTNNVTILNTLLSTDSTSSLELSAVIYSGVTDGYLREISTNTMYEVQIYVTGGGVNDNVICRNARIEVSYSSPILVTALVPLALPIDINFICGTHLNGFSTPASVGGRYFSMSNFPASLPDNRARTLKFYADVEVSAPGVTGYLQLFDTTHNIAITGTTFTFTNTSNVELNATLSVGSSNGSIRTDISSRYEIRMWKSSGSPADRVICNNARITVTYI